VTAHVHANKVCVVGSSNLDLVATTSRLPNPGETVLGRDFHEHPGGKGLNQAVAAARAGAATSLLSAVGDDTAADVLLAVMDADGIDRAFVARRPGLPTGRALIGVADSGENSIIVVPGANERVEVDKLPEASVVLAQLEVPLEAIRVAFTHARSLGVLTVLNPAPAAELPHEVLGLCDLVVPNEHEVELLGGVTALLDSGVRAVVVTRGAAGAELHEPGSHRHIEPFAVTPVDTTGAGDTFCGALCARLAAGSDLGTALEYAAAAAALSTTRHGAVPSIPTRDETERFMREAGRAPG
jgi:ribokinase